MTATGPTVYFEDSTFESSSIIISTDGGTSQVRRWLLGDLAAQELLPYAFINFPFTLPAKKALYLNKVINPNIDIATHPKNIYLGIFLLDKPELTKLET